MRAVVIAVALASLACTKRAPPTPDASARPAALDDPASSPRVVAAVRAVRARCTAAIGDYDDDCDAARAYRALKPTKADAATLVALMEDRDAGLVKLGAYHAARHRDLFREDAALAARLVAVGEELPPQADVAPELAGILCRIDRGRTSLGPRIVELARAGRREDLRAGLVSCLLRESPADPEIAKLTDEAARDPVEIVRRAAAVATARPPTAEQCEEWSKALSSPGASASAVGEALGKVLSGERQRENPFVRGRPNGDAHNGCPPAAIDAALAAYPRRFEDGALDDAWLDYLGALGHARNVTPAQRTTAFAFAKKVYEWSPSGAAGRGALFAMAELDPEVARPIVLAHGADGGSTAAERERKLALERLEERAAED